MHDFKYWCSAICVVVIISGVLLTFIPDSKLNKSYKGLVALMIIFMLISPFSKAKSIDTFVVSENYSSDISKEELMINDSNLVLDCAENLLNSTLNDALNKVGIDVQCGAHIKENDGEAYISKIDVYGELTEKEESEVISIINGITGGVEIEFVG